MDNGPFRAPRSAETDRRVARPEPAQRKPQEPQPIEEPKVYQPAPTYVAPKEEKKFRKRLFIPLIAIVVIILAAVGLFYFTNKQGAVAPIDTSKYQAVFSTSGLVYFGKLESVNKDYFKLSKVYYLQSSTTGTAAATTDATTSNDQKLIKLSDAIHGPEDEMVIPKAQVLFYENLKADSKVSQAIAKDNS